ncbi:unnamed protein product [Arabidopsis lyrata]|nr:unnamed protein product [Arabidopsis lyrata]
MWGCLKGEIDVHRLGVKDLQDLSSVIENYPNTVTSRIKSLKKNGEPSSSLPPLVVPDEAVVAVPIRFYNPKYHSQIQDMN